MALDIDTTRPFLSLAARRRLIEAVRDAPPAESEPDWIEWKGRVDLSSKRWMAEIARHIVGFANRDPTKAHRAADGFGYILIGVEPGKVWGVDPIDNAQLESGTTPYLGLDGPQASPEYVDVDGKPVLVISVAPPRAGDRIFAFEKEYQHEDDDGVRISYRNGEVFVRRDGRTERARAADLRMLERRLLAGESKAILDVELVWEGEEAKPLTPVKLDEAEFEMWEKSERARLRRPPDAVLNPPTASALIRDAERTRGLFGWSSWEPENRTPDEYDSAVEAYLERAAAEFPALVRGKAAEQRLGFVELAVANNTQDNYEAVVMELHLPGAVRAYFTEDDAWDEAAAFPRSPRKWGPWRKNPLASYASSMRVHPHLPSAGLLSRGQIENSGSAHITFEPVDLRPGHCRRLHELHVIVTVPPFMTEIVGSWSATSTSVSGVAEGTLAFEIDPPVGAVDLLKRPASVDEAD
jgi:hypothetical protein